MYNFTVDWPDSTRTLFIQHFEYNKALSYTFGGNNENVGWKEMG